MNISVTSIAEDQHGYLWITTWGNGLLRFDLKNMNARTFYHSRQSNSVSSNRTTKIIIDRME